ncbi:MAG: hypothetical protein AAGI48_09560 [Verrucomicrobiota bacterium]
MAQADADGPDLWRRILKWWWWIPVIAAITCLSYLSPSAFWIDADQYTAALEEDRKVIHPPGYVGFIAAAKSVHQFVESPYRSFQIVSLLSYLASIPLVHFAIRRQTAPRTASILTLTYALGWIPLNIATIGTSHASDLLFAAVLVFLTSRGKDAASSWWWHLALFTTVAWAASFRLSSVVMAGPFLLLVALRDFRIRSFWMSGLVGAALLGLVLAWTAKAYGGWSNYREASAALHALNAPSGLLTGGSLKSAGMNLVRGGWWLWLALPVLPVLAVMPSQRQGMTHRSWETLFPAALAGGVIFVIFGYLCAHPGYLAMALPPLFVLIAQFLGKAPLLIRACLVQLAITLMVFFIPRPIQPPASAAEAAANGLLLQYTASAHRSAVKTRSLSSWLHEAGRDDLIPGHRREKAASEAD